jgi:hypothetical protein
MADLDRIRQTLAAAAAEQERLARQLADSANALAAERAKLIALQASADPAGATATCRWSCCRFESKCARRRIADRCASASSTTRSTPNCWTRA